MALLAEYRTRSIPRLTAGEVDIRRYDLYTGQRALWSVLILQMVRRHRLTAEIRFGSLAPSSPAFVCLRLHGQPSEDIRNELRQVEELLPPEYQWESAPTPEPPARVRIARVVRRVEMVDLPAVSLSALRGGTWVPEVNRVPAPGATPAPAPSPRAQIPLLAGNLTLVRTGQSRSLREIPGAETTFDEMLIRQFCMPLPGLLSEHTPRARALFQGIQRAGFALVSLCLHPMEPAERTRLQGVALHFERILDPFLDHMKSHGFTDATTLKTAFSRFALPEGYLFYVSIRVAAATTAAAVSVANLVAESRGGALAFRVLPPTKDVSAAALIDPELDVSGPGWSEQRHAGERARQQRELAENHVAAVEDPEIAGFLLHLPHVYSLHEAARVLWLPEADDEGLPGLSTHVVPPFAVPSLSFLPVLDAAGTLTPPPSDRVRLGMLQTAGLSAGLEPAARFAGQAWHSLDPRDLTKHALIVGSTGSGKSLTTLFLARELARLQVPLMIVEPVKTEYYARLQGKVPGLLRASLEGGENGRPGRDYLAFDPLRIPPRTTVARHCSYLKSCFEAAFSLNEFLAILLENGLLAYYQGPKEEGGCALHLFSRGGPATGEIRDGRVYPSFATFRRYFTDTFLKRELESYVQNRQDTELRQIVDIFKRRFVNLGEGVIGQCFKLADALYLSRHGDPRAYDPFETYLAHSLVVELDALPDADHKALLMALLLSRLYEYRQAEDFHARNGGPPLSPGLRHFLIVEEAHRLLSNEAVGARRSQETVGQSAKAKAVQLFVDMLAEVRAYGQGLAIVEQIPTKIVPEAVKNTNLKIMLRLTSSDDREFLGSAMSFTPAQMRFVTHLKADRQQINLVVFEEGVEQPLLLSLPLPASPQAPLYAEHFPETPP